MTPAQLLVELHNAGAVVTFDPGGLRVQAPKGVLTPERREAITAHRDALLALVIAEHDQAAMDALDDSLSADGAEPEPREPLPGSLAASAHAERWDMEATARSIVALSDEKRAVFRAALAFDTEALKRADAMLAAREGRPGSAVRADA